MKPEIVILRFKDLVGEDNVTVHATVARSDGRAIATIVMTGTLTERRPTVTTNDYCLMAETGDYIDFRLRDVARIETGNVVRIEL